MRLTSTIRPFFALLLLLAPAAASAQDSQALSVSEVQLGTSLNSGVVETPTTTFSRTDGRIYAVVRVLNPARTETSIRVALESADGPERPGVSLDIPARPRYRTVARFGASHPPGSYRVVVRNAEGEVLQTTQLTITE